MNQKYGHINHRGEIDKFGCQNQQNSGTSVPLGIFLSLYIYHLSLLLSVYLFSVIVEHLPQYYKNIGADSPLVLHLITHITKGRQTLFP